MSWIDLIQTCGTNAELFLRNVHNIIDVDAVLGKWAATEFQAYYVTMLNRFVHPSQLLLEANYVTTQYLPHLYERHEIPARAYDYKNKWKALLTSAMIQQSVHLLLIEDPMYFQRCRVEMVRFVEEIGNIMIASEDCLNLSFMYPLQLPFAQEHEMVSLTRFFVAMKEACKVFGHAARWENLAILLCCFSTGENQLFSRGGAETVSTTRRRHLFTLFHSYYYLTHQGKRSFERRKRMVHKRKKRQLTHGYQADKSKKAKKTADENDELFELLSWLDV